jgi:hypothetical protein
VSISDVQKPGHQLPLQVVTPPRTVIIIAGSLGIRHISTAKRDRRKLASIILLSSYTNDPSTYDVLIENFWSCIESPFSLSIAALIVQPIVRIYRSR